MLKRLCDLCEEEIESGDFLGEITFKVTDSSNPLTDFKDEKGRWNPVEKHVGDVCGKCYMLYRKKVADMTFNL